MLYPGVNKGAPIEREPSHSLDREAVQQERERLLAEVRSLEEENHQQARQAKALQIQLSDRRRLAQRLIQHSAKVKEDIAQFLARENDLIQESLFLELERERCGEDYKEVAGRVNANLASVAAILRDIEFMRGEIETLRDETGYLERGVSYKVRDIDRLDNRISGLLQALEELYHKMRAVEKNTKIIYYRKERDGGQSPLIP